MNEDRSNSPWLISLLDGLCAVVLVLILMIHPPAKNEDVKSPGNITAEIRWPDECGADVDLWAKGPQGAAVGYSNQHGPIFNILRDDRGRDTDMSGLNYESTYSRGAPAGDYAINIHLYSNFRACPYPIPVDVQVTLTPEPNLGGITLVKKRFYLNAAGEEVTVARFTLNEHKRLVGKVHTIPVKLTATRNRRIGL